MLPILIKFGPITIYTYGVFIAMAILLAIAITVREAKQKSLEYSLVFDLSFCLILSAILGSRILYVLLKPQYFINNPLKIFQFWKGGLVFSGGVFAAILAGWVYLYLKKQSFWPWTDAFAPGIAAGQALGRIGCLMAGCCYGETCKLPWAITFTHPQALAPLHIPLHPTQIYHSLAGAITFFILYLSKKRLQYSGQLFALLLICYSIFRIMIEFFRGDYRGYLGPMSVTQWVTLGIFILGITIFLHRRSTKEKT